MARDTTYTIVVLTCVIVLAHLFYLDYTIIQLHHDLATLIH